MMATTAVRWLLLAHRYLGIGIGLLMVVWCLSGFVMMYVPYPQLPEVERVRHLAPINWRRCCVIEPEALAAQAPIAMFQLEDIEGRATLRVRYADGYLRMVDLESGAPNDGIAPGQAAAVAARYVEPGLATRAPRLADTIGYDQWTVQGAHRPDRPLYRFELHDSRSTEVYVSSRDGHAVQMTTARVRFWNWLGAVPHWIYFPALRSHPAAWTQVVVGTSIVGCFLTITGLIAGIVQIKRATGGRWVPYRGFHHWHHVLGLIFGLFVLTWVASGLVSMNPWGFLEGGSLEEPARLQGAPITPAAVAAAVRNLPHAAPSPDILGIESAPLNGGLFLVATRSNGQRYRLDANGAPLPLSRSDLDFIAGALDPAVGGYTLETVVAQDDYYFSHQRDRAQLPALRAMTHHVGGSRYYLDPVSAKIWAKFDRDNQRYRWLHQALHRLDFNPTVRSHPLWDFLTASLLGGATAVCALGTYLGLRSLQTVRRRNRGNRAF
jgi:uncharacterized iron-regulated membrane protein